LALYGTLWGDFVALHKLPYLLSILRFHATLDGMSRHGEMLPRVALVLP